MAIAPFNFTTGETTLPDVGELSYNGCLFSPLYETTVSGTVVKDNAQRTTKLMDYTLTADGYVTLPAGATDVAGVMTSLRNTLTAHGGALIYKGRGFDLSVNVGVDFKGPAGSFDAVWGPVPELLEFQPLGGGLSAKVRWQIKVRIPEITAAKSKGALGPLLQFNSETVVTYSEDGYSSLSIKGTLEIPLTRSPNQKIRTLTSTVDDYRSILDTRIMAGIDLSRFRVTRRNFSISRDKRTLEWDFAAEEKPYMDLPIGCTIARGSYSVRPAKAGMGLCMWLCTLKATYTVRADRPRRIAWAMFLAMLRLRMSQSKLGNIPPLDGGNQNPGRGAVGALFPAVGAFLVGQEISKFVRDLIAKQNKPVAEARKAWLIDFSFDEGLYLDSKTTSFSATWRLVTTFSHILLASGLWKKLPEEDNQGNNLWATTVGNIQGSQSWLPNKLDPKLDVIVDFGGG